jgi:hypothetical protein
VMFMKPIFDGKPSSPVCAMSSMQTIQISIH